MSSRTSPQSSAAARCLRAERLHEHRERLGARDRQAGGWRSLGRRRFQPTAASPTRPGPRRNSVEGSGTAASTSDWIVTVRPRKSMTVWGLPVSRGQPVPGQLGIGTQLGKFAVKGSEKNPTSSEAVGKDERGPQWAATMSLRPPPGSRSSPTTNVAGLKAPAGSTPTATIPNSGPVLEKIPARSVRIVTEPPACSVKEIDAALARAAHTRANAIKNRAWAARLNIPCLRPYPLPAA
jgi:hypothetical protein